MLGNPDLRRVMAGVVNVPTPPKTYLELTTLLRDDAASIKAVAAVLRRDPGLSAKILQVANSSFFARPTSPIGDVQQAVVRIGPRHIATLALSDGMFRRASKDVTQLQNQSLRIAHIARALAQGSTVADEAFTAGLVADVGLVVLQDNDVTGVEPHAEALHAVVGAYLLSLWALPAEIVEAVAYHHSPGQIARQSALLSAVTYAAACLATGESVDPEVVSAYGLDIARASGCGGMP